MVILWNNFPYFSIQNEIHVYGKSDWITLILLVWNYDNHLRSMVYKWKQIITVSPKKTTKPLTSMSVPVQSESYFPCQIFSCIKGWESAWLMLILLAGSNIRTFSRRSLSWWTFRSWSSGSRWNPINSARRSLEGEMVLRIVVFS